MSDKKCCECGGRLDAKHYKMTTKIGDVVVVDATATVLVCQSCGEPNLTLGEVSAYERRAAATVLRDGTRVDGCVVRFARKALGLRQCDIAALLDKAPETVARWEIGAAKIARAEQLAIIALIHGTDALVNSKLVLSSN
jgi:DNA-binding transcriptional regulator YiaG